MATIEYRTPGVYIEEISTGVRPIQTVGTRTAGFVGASPNSAVPTNEVQVLNSWNDFERRYMSAVPAVVKQAEAARANVAAAQKQLDLLPKSASDSERKTAQDNLVQARQNAKADIDAANQTFSFNNLAHAVQGFFLNGGSRCYVVNIGSPGLVQEGLDLLGTIDEIAIVAVPGDTTKATYTAVRDHCDRLKDRVGILDGPQNLDDDSMLKLSGEAGLGGGNWEMADVSERGHVTMYVPWLQVANPHDDPNKDDDDLILVPPSGHIAGVWARTDAMRGVHKAPANEIVRGVLGLERRITHVENGYLNDNGVNVIRYFRQEGYLVWGARTLSKDVLWRYLNVRRLFNMIEESIAEGTRWIVFEPNDAPLWQAIRRDISAFLIGFWRDGALMGSTPEEAFFVKCDAETNTPETINEGKVIIEIGIAPVKPAEFVIFRISQYEAGSDINVSGG